MQAVKRVQPSLVALHKMAKIKIFVKSNPIQGGGLEMAAIISLWQNFNNNNSGQFVLPHPSFTRHTIYPNCVGLVTD